MENENEKEIEQEQEIEIYNNIGTTELVTKTYSFLKNNIKEILKLILFMIIWGAIFFVAIGFSSAIIINAKIIDDFIATLMVMVIFGFAIFYLQSIYISTLKNLCAMWFLNEEKPKLKDCYKNLKGKKINVFKSNLIKRIILYFFILIHISPYIANFVGLALRHQEYNMDSLISNAFFNPAIIIIAFILFIPCIYFGLRTAFNLESVIFNDKLAMESIEDSMSITKNKALSLLFYYIVISIITHIITGVLTLFIEFFIIMPSLFISTTGINEIFLSIMFIILMICLIALGIIINSAIYVGETIKFIDIIREKNLKSCLQNND